MFCRPLNYFASLYRQVQKNMMNMDKMLAMMEIEPAVKVRLGIQHLSRGPCNCFLFSVLPIVCMGCFNEPYVSHEHISLTSHINSHTVMI